MTTSVVSGAVASQPVVVMETYIWVCSVVLLLTHETIKKIYIQKTEIQQSCIVVKRNVQGGS